MVAGEMAKRVVDMLEVVEIEQHQPDVPTGLPRLFRDLVEMGFEGATVGQAGQGVALAGMAQAIGTAALLGDVARDEENLFDLPAGVPDRGQDVVPPPGLAGEGGAISGEARGFPAT